MTMMKRMATAGGDAGDRARSPERAMSASEAPPRRVDAQRMIDVVDGAGEAHAADQPDEPRRVAELRRQHRPDQRPGARDRREMVAEQHPARRRVVVVAVGLDVRRRRPACRPAP